MPETNKMDRAELVDYVRELECENQKLRKALQQAAKYIETSSKKSEELEKTLQEAFEDSPDELPQPRLNKDEAEEALANLEETVDEVTERLDEIGRW